MKEILITTPAEIVGIPKNEENTAIVRLGHLFKFPKKYIKSIKQLVSFIKNDNYYVIFEVKLKNKIDYVTGKIEEIETYYFYHEKSTDGASFLLSVSEEDFSKLYWMYNHSLYKASTIPRFGRSWKTMEIWNFNGIILKQTNETLEDLKCVGIGLLSMFRKVIEPEMVDLWV